MKYFIYSIIVAAIFFIIFIGFEINKTKKEELENNKKIEFKLKARIDYLNKFEGGVPIVEQKEWKYNSRPELITNGKLNNCAIYNVCPKGNEVTKIIIEKVWLPDKSAFLNCAGTDKFIGVWDSKSDVEYEKTLPQILINNNWGIQAMRCDIEIGANKLKYYISYTKQLFTIYEICTKPNIRHLPVPYAEADRVKWQNCINNNTGLWLRENTFTEASTTFNNYLSEIEGNY